MDAYDPDAGPAQPTVVGMGGEGASSAKFVYASGAQPLSGYTIKRGVGHGGFGEVYYAVSDAGKDVALKLIRRNLDVELRGMRHCLNLKHPNLLSIHDIRRDDHGDNWVIMEYINGGRLDDVITAHPQGLSQDQALAWFFGIAAGVAYLHDHGIVHRDLKPGNIFCDEGVVKLGDYGLSKFISCSRRSGQTESVGTVHYMAPEIANGRYGKEIDIYALGVILYEILTGRVPFEGESVGEVLMKHLTTEPDLSMLSEPFRRVIGTALQKDPANRFKSVPEMLRELPRPLRPEVYAGPISSAGTDRGPGAAVPPQFSPLGGEVPLAEVVDEEPVFGAVRRFCRRGYDSWTRSSFNMPTKIALVVVGVGVLLMTSHGWVPVLVFLVVLYACYWVVRAILTAVVPNRTPPPLQSGPATPPPLRGVAAGPGPGGGATSSPPSPTWPSPPSHGGTWPHPPRRRHDPQRDLLVLPSPRQRIAQWIGALVGSTLVTLTVGLVILVLSGFREGASQPPLWGMTWWGQYAWLVVVSLAGAWAVLTVSKFWEGGSGDAMTRRFLLMVVGLGLGLAAFWSTSWFGVELTHDRHFMQLASFRAHQPLGPADGWPESKYYLASFGTLLLLVRWWRQADPARGARLSLWAVVVSVLVAALVADLWGFPQPWLPMVACSMSVAVQLASAWLPPDQRRWQSPSA